MSDETDRNDSILSVDDVARRLGCSRYAVYSAIRRSELKAARINGRGDFRIRDEWVQAWLDARSLCANAAFDQGGTLGG